MSIANEKQTWWDAICNVQEASYDLMTAPNILNNKQYAFYKSLRDDRYHGHTSATYGMTTEEQFMYICFMAAFHDYE